MHRFHPRIALALLFLLAPGFAFAEANEPPQDNPELAKMYEEDQGDRSKPHGEIDWKVVSARDAQHRERVKELLAQGAVKTANDHYHAAMVFQHGSRPEDAKLAHELARTAAEMDPDHEIAAWLSAAAWDRYKMYLGEPQWYGTQFRRGKDGVWVLYEIDEEAVTDEERQALGVPTLAESRKRAEAMNQRQR